MISESVTRDGKTTVWEREKKIKDDIYEWEKCESSPSEIRTGVSKLNANSEFLFFYYDNDKANNKVDAATKDGKEHHIDLKTGSDLILKNGLEHEIQYPYPFGTKYIFDRHNLNDSKEITSMTIKTPRSVEKYEKVAGSDDLWRSGNKDFHWQIALNNKEFVLTDLTDTNNPSRTTRTLDGREIVEHLKTGDTVETKNGFVTRVKHDRHEARFTLAKQDKKICGGYLDGTYTKEIEDTRRNWHLTKQADNSWKVERLDAQKPFVSPADKSVGDAEVNERGDYTLAREDHIRTRFNQDGTIDQNLGNKDDLSKRINENNILDVNQKWYLVNDYLPKN